MYTPVKPTFRYIRRGYRERERGGGGMAGWGVRLSLHRLANVMYVHAIKFKFF